MTKAVLLADDSVSLRTVVRIALVRAGDEVVEAADGQDGLAELGTPAKLQLIGSDRDMLRSGGIGFVTALKQQTRHACVTLTMLTSEGRDEKQWLGRAAGAKAWIVKPFQPQQLLDVAAKLMLP